MVRRKLTIPVRWQSVGMHNGGFSHRRVADHFRVNYSIIVRLMQRFRQTGNVTDRPRPGRPRKTTPREDRLISRRARQRPFITVGALRGNLAFGAQALVARTPPFSNFLFTNLLFKCLERF
jgi:transposase